MSRLRPWALPLALLAGLLTGLGFAPWSWWPCTLLGVAAFVLLVRPAHTDRPGLVGLVYGLAWFTLTISWLSVMGWWVGALLVVVWSLWTAGLALMLRAVQTLPWWPVWVACSWSTMEFLSSRVPFGGFGWVRLAYTTADMPLGGLLGWIGAGGVSWAFALVAASLAGLETCPPRAPRRAHLVALVTGLLVASGLLRLLPAPPVEDTVNVGVVQGNVDGSAGPRSMGYARSVTNNHLGESITLLAKVRAGLAAPPDFLLWPENATDIDPTVDAQTAELIKTSVQLGDLPILVGSVMDGPGEDGRQTSALWWTTSHTVPARYDKRNAVPFGEYTPLRPLLFRLVPMTQMVGRQTVPGSGPRVMQVLLPDGRPLAIGNIICYELAFDDTVYSAVTEGADLITVQSNNGTYTGTIQPAQQFQITRVRAMELQRDIVVSTTNALSGHIDAQGNVLAATGQVTNASDTYSVALRTNVSPAVRVGPVWEGLAALAGALAFLFARRRSELAAHRTA